MPDHIPNANKFAERATNGDPVMQLSMTYMTQLSMTYMEGRCL